jgi:hypothetical protein
VTSPKLLIPLRIPEIGPALGKLVTGTNRRPVGISLEPVRDHLVNRLIGSLGEARRLASNGERDAALSTLGRSTWLGAWEEAVGSVASHLEDKVNQRLDAEARAVRMAKRLRRGVALSPAERRALAARLGTTAAGLIPVLEGLEERRVSLANATALQRDALEAWQQAILGVARQFEAAWLALEQAVETELAHWSRVADDVSQWRRPLWPVVAIGVVGAALACWVGLVWGGVLSPPNWMVNIWRLMFGS